MLVTAQMGVYNCLPPGILTFMCRGRGLLGLRTRGQPSYSVVFSVCLGFKRWPVFKIEQEGTAGSRGAALMLPCVTRQTPLSRENLGSEETAVLVEWGVTSVFSWSMVPILNGGANLLQDIHVIRHVIQAGMVLRYLMPRGLKIHFRM